MKVFLPSNNMMGHTSVEMREPKIEDMRKIPNFNQQSSIIKKTEFVHELVGDVVYELTPQDRDYLFVLGVGAIRLNRISMVVKCSCGRQIKDELTTGELYPIRLPRSVRREYRAKIYGKDYTFHKLSVKEEVAIEERAIDLPDEAYTNEFQDGMVAASLGYGIEAEGIEKVRKMDLSIYYAALLYQNTDAHGVSIIRDLVCPECGKKIKAYRPITGDMLNVNVSDVINRYVTMSEYVSMDNYMEMTLSEYNVFVSALNQKLKSQQK